MKAKGFRPLRWVQYLLLAGFLIGFLVPAHRAWKAWLPDTALLQLDPSAVLPPLISLRGWMPEALPAVILLALTFFLGRFYCGCMCPLGALQDLAQEIAPRRGKHRESPSFIPSGTAAILLCFLLGAAAGGYSLTALLSPLSLAGRTAALILSPLVHFMGDTGLHLLEAPARRMDIPSLVYADIRLRHADFIWITVLITAAILAAARRWPRFWCRYLCPAGVIFSLFSRAPIIRRRVSDDCVHCGKCRDACPTRAIRPDFGTIHQDCITCQTCVDLCPVDAISFCPASPFQKKSAPASDNAENAAATAPSDRRAFLMRAAVAFGGGLGASMLGLSALPVAGRASGKFSIRDRIPIRPPGSRPETDFLHRCIRCGACMAACPTNTLQPLDLRIGADALFTPEVRPRIGPCRPDCHSCAAHCPTGAIRLADAADRVRIKIGTAHILRHRCLAWEFQRACMVCDEVCPYDAISLEPEPRAGIPSPVIREDRCAGCGFCQHHCPVPDGAAIRVTDMEALRLNKGKYADAGEALGMDLRINRREEDAAYGPSDLEGGAGEEEGLPPGFTVE